MTTIILVSDSATIYNSPHFHYRIKSQEALPSYSRQHAYLFLHACIFDKDATKRALQKYASIRAGAPDLFDNRDPFHEDIQQVYRMA